MLRCPKKGFYVPGFSDSYFLQSCRRSLVPLIPFTSVSMQLETSAAKPGPGPDFMPLVLCTDCVPAVDLLTLQLHLQRGIQASTNIICERSCRFFILTHPLLPCRRNESSYLNCKPSFQCLRRTCVLERDQSDNRLEVCI